MAYLLDQAWLKSKQRNKQKGVVNKELTEE